MHGIVKKKNLIVLHQRGEAVRKSGTEKNCGKIAENCGKLRKIAENCEKLRNCGKLQKIADLNFSPPLNIMHKDTKNQSYVGSSGQTLTTNVSMTLCDSQIRHQTHVLCGFTTFGTELKSGPKLIRSLRLL